MDRLRAMGVFIAVSEAGSLSAAARALGQPLTTVSRVLAQLEAHLGCTLLERSTRRLALTSAGSEYLETCRRVIEAVETSEQRLAGKSGDISGDLAITAPVFFGRLHLLPLIAQFLALYPRINARILLVDRVVDLLEEGIDVALRIGPLRDSALIATHVGELKLITCASKAYLERRGIPANPSALTEHDCVTFSGLPGGLRWTYHSRKYGRKAIRVRSRLSVNTADAAVAAAVEGVGLVRVLSYQADAALRAGQLIPLLTRFEDAAVPVHLVYRHTRSNNPRVRSFVDYASTKLRKNTASIS